MIYLHMAFVSAYLYLEFSGVSPKIYLPYRLGAFVISTQLIYFFAFGNTWHCFRQGTFVEHFFYAFVILAGLFIGTYFGKPGCTNVSMVWAAFWIITTGTDLLFRNAKDLAIIWIFFSFVGLYYLALWLNAHPEFLASMISLD